MALFASLCALSCCVARSNVLQRCCDTGPPYSAAYLLADGKPGHGAMVADTQREVVMEYSSRGSWG